MIRPLLLTLFVLLCSTACAPLVELEDENIALRAKVDSLEIVLTECRGQGELLGDRLAAIEAQNLALDDRNRELMADLAEARYRPAADAEQAGAPGPEPVSDGSTRPVRTVAAGSATEQEPPPAVPAEREPPPPAVPAEREPPPPAASAEQGEVFPVAESAAARNVPRPTASFEAGTPAGLAFLRRYQEALSAYNAGRFAEASALFEALLAGGERNDMIDNCLYWLGEAEAQRGRTTEAIDFFTRAIACRGGDKVDDALLSRATARRAAGDAAAARDDLQRLLSEHPQSELTSQARGMLRGLQ